ncbi:hypothetical protein CR513_26950, partial [Mucuna pruriens]
MGSRRRSLVIKRNQSSHFTLPFVILRNCEWHSYVAALALTTTSNTPSFLKRANIANHLILTKNLEKCPVPRYKIVRGIVCGDEEIVKT